MDAISFIKQYKLVPVVVFEKLDDAEGALKALCDGGLPIAEITFRTACAPDAIKLAVNKFPQMLVGAGTIINKAQAKEAVDCGAKFIVGPGFCEEVAAYCKERSVPYIPGVVTPTEIIKAVSMGLTLLKFFPAQSFGGLKTIKDLSAAFPQVQFMPTGGVSAENVNEFLAFSKIAACGGSWMMKGSVKEIEENTKKAMQIIKGDSK